MYLKSYIILVLLALSSSCAFVPEISEDQPYANQCDILTRDLTLSVTEIKGKKCSADEDIGLCIAAYALIIPAGSFILSGSYVLAGNGIHWLEYQSRCEDGSIRKHIEKLHLTLAN